MVFKKPISFLLLLHILLSLSLSLAPPAEVPKPPPSICENFCLKTRAENHPRNQAGMKISEAETLTQTDLRSFPVSAGWKKWSLGLESTPPKSLGDERPGQHLLIMAGEPARKEDTFAFVSAVCSFFNFIWFLLGWDLLSFQLCAFFFFSWKKLSRTGCLLDISSCL